MDRYTGPGNRAGLPFPVGIYAHLILSEVIDTDLIVPTLVNDASVFPLWATDFLIVSILAAAMSSMDSVLLVAASTLYKNIVAPSEALTERRGHAPLSLVSRCWQHSGTGIRRGISSRSLSSQAACTQVLFPAVVFGLYWEPGSPRRCMSMAVGITTLTCGLQQTWDKTRTRSSRPAFHTHLHPAFQRRQTCHN